MEIQTNRIVTKPVIMQHNTVSFINNGGPATGVRLLMESSLKSKYRFIPLMEKTGPTISIIRDLVSQIKSAKPDLIHIRGLQSSGFYGLLAARLSGCKKVVVSVHGTSIDSEIGLVKKTVYKNIIERFTLKNADLVYCVCQYAAQRPYIVDNTKNLYGYIHNAAPDYSMYNKKQLRESIRDSLGISSDEIVVASVGRIVIEKGIEYLIQSIKLLYDQVKIRFVIVGEGNYLSVLKNLLSKEIESRRVLVLGRRSDIANILFASDIFVFPTLRENLSNALLEASAAALPIIATEVGGNSEIISHNYNGILIPPCDGVKLATQIKYLASNPHVRSEIGRNALTNVRTLFDQKSIFNQIDEMYTKILNL